MREQKKLNGWDWTKWSVTWCGRLANWPSMNRLAILNNQWPYILSVYVFVEDGPSKSNWIIITGHALPVHSSMTIHSNCRLGREQKYTYVDALTVFSWGEWRFNDFKIGSSATSYGIRRVSKWQNWSKVSQSGLHRAGGEHSPNLVGEHCPLSSAFYFIGSRVLERW